jgi:hypothetical protein
MAPNARAGLRRLVPSATHSELDRRIALICWRCRRFEGVLVVTVANTAIKFEVNGVDLMLPRERRISVTRFATPLLNTGVTTRGAIAGEGFICKIAGNINYTAAIIQIVLTPRMAGIAGDIRFTNMSQVCTRARRLTMTILTLASPDQRLMTSGAAACLRGRIKTAAIGECHTNGREIFWIYCRLI